MTNFSIQILIREHLTRNAGLQFPNVRRIDVTMEASWLKRIYKSNEAWATIPNFYGLNMMYVYGDVYLERKHKTVCNTLWRDVIQSVQFMYKNST